MGHRPLRRRGEINVQADELRRRIEMLERRHYDEAGFVTYPMKLFADANALDGLLPAAATDVVAGDGKFITMMEAEYDGWYLVLVQAFVSTVGAGDTVIQVRNITGGDVDMLTSGCVIPGGDFTSGCQPEDLPEIDYANDRADACDLIAIDVDSAGAGAQGLGVFITFSDTPLDAT